MEIRVIIKFKTGEIRDYLHVISVKLSDAEIELVDYLGARDCFQLADIETSRICPK